jgi:hypothetical protein
MSDKETAPLNWTQKAALEYLRQAHPDLITVMVEELAGIISKWHAVECTAPAPQNPWKEVIADACCAICTEFYPDDPLKSLSSLIHWQVQTALDPRVSEAAAKLLAATPQVTPWKSHFTDSDVTGDIHNYVDTGDGKRLWAQDAAEIVKRHNEGTSEQASPTPDKCPTCGSHLTEGYCGPSQCQDSWHSSAATQKGTTKE